MSPLGPSGRVRSCARRARLSLIALFGIGTPSLSLAQATTPRDEPPAGDFAAGAVEAAPEEPSGTQPGEPPAEAPPTEPTQDAGAALPEEETRPDVVQSPEESEASEETEKAKPPPLEAVTQSTEEKVEANEPNQTTRTLVARPEEKAQSSQQGAKRHVLITKPLVAAPAREVNRHRRVPGDYVARPLTLPQGTFAFSFGYAAAFINTETQSASSPAFSFGITSRVEVGLDAPLRFDQGLGEWTVLAPRGHVAATWLDLPEVEVGTRVALLVAGDGQGSSQLEVGLPVIWHESSRFRFDGAAELGIGFEDKMQVSVGLPLGASAQLSPALFTGIEVRPELGLTSGRSEGVDGKLVLGTTLQSRRQAKLDLVGSFFVKNFGTGAGDKFSDGAGIMLSLHFYPELY